MQIDHSARAIRSLARTGLQQLHYLIIRFGIASAPVNLLLNVDDVVCVALALNA